MLASGGNRLDWPDLPLQVREALTARLNARVVAWASSHSGFSPGLASLLTLDDGRQVFAKAVSAERNSRAVELHRQEIAVLELFDQTVPAPQLITFYDDGQWVALVCDFVAGRHPGAAWTDADIEQVGYAVIQLGRIPPAPSWNALPTLVERTLPTRDGWRQLASAPDRLAQVGSWAQRHIDEIISYERAWPRAAAGTALVHGDLRADNLLMTSQGVMFVDWPFASRGAPWVDLILMLPSMSMQGAGSCAGLLDRFAPEFNAPEVDVTAAIAALSGYFLANSFQPHPPNLPRLRPFQRRQGETALAWLQERL